MQGSCPKAGRRSVMPPPPVDQVVIEPALLTARTEGSMHCFMRSLGQRPIGQGQGACYPQTKTDTSNNDDVV
jgi:hypothetical protein